MNQKRIWITWETQRRSVELSKILKCNLYIIELNGLFRYPFSIVKTLYIIVRENPQILFVQNPSMVLAAFASLYCKITHLPLVVDRHTTFLLDNPIASSWRRWIFLLLHRFTIKNAFITIVTNDHLADLVLQSKGNPFILPDPLPALSPKRIKTLAGGTTILVPSSFRMDEPIHQIIESATFLTGKNIFMYITGNISNFKKRYKGNMPANVQLTGLLPEQDYIDLLFSVNAVMVLTTASSCMLCGCYEAVSAEKPLITSDKPALRNYFFDALFVDNSVERIVQACSEVANSIESYTIKSRNMKTTLAARWTEHHTLLEVILSSHPKKLFSE
jgi:ribosomal protein L31